MDTAKPRQWASELKEEGVTTVKKYFSNVKSSRNPAKENASNKKHLPVLLGEKKKTKRGSGERTRLERKNESRPFLRRKKQDTTRI